MTRDGAARLARQAHNLKVVGSNPTPATIKAYQYPSNYPSYHRKSQYLLFKALRKRVSIPIPASSRQLTSSTNIILTSVYFTASLVL